MKRITVLVIALLLVFGVVNTFAGVETVKDNNDGNKGYILVNIGTKNGQSDVGTWTDPSFLKGDKGNQGIQGLQGIGITGANGYTPIKDVDYFDGVNGKNGVDGIGIDGEKGDIGNDGYTPIKGVDYFDGLAGIQGIAGKDVDPTIVNNLQNNINNANSRIDNINNRVSNLEKRQINIRTELKFIRERYLEVGLYSVYSTTRSTMAEVGLNVVIPIGESYQDREAKKVNMRLNRLEKQIGNSAVIEKTLDSRGNIKSISISSGKVAFGGAF